MVDIVSYRVVDPRFLIFALVLSSGPCLVADAQAPSSGAGNETLPADSVVSQERLWTMVVTNQSRSGAASQDRMGLFSTADECIASLELEVGFKAASLRRLGHSVSVMNITRGWTLFTIETIGDEAGRPKAIAAYTCANVGPN